ncbi:MAG TPA: S24 family peptidase [Lacunisphaera sp.]|nr:S24 family peptidase [Lacunisphaera sp.]
MSAINDRQWIHGLFAETSPQPVALGETDAWQQASALAERTPDAFVLIGSGRSMHPLYTPGTILVMQKSPYADLRRGQTVLYRNHQQKVVAHLLIAKVRDGWRAQGLNNSAHDMEPVNADNFVGVVIAAFKPSGPDRTLSLASTR